MSEGEQAEHEGEATALWSILLGALHNDRRKRQPEMLVPPTENMAAAEAIKANETVETEAVSARWLSWAERRSEWTVRRPLARRPAHPLPPHLPAAEQVYKTLKARQVVLAREATIRVCSARPGEQPGAAPSRSRLNSSSLMNSMPSLRRMCGMTIWTSSSQGP